MHFNLYPHSHLFPYLASSVQESKTNDNKKPHQNALNKTVSSYADRHFPSLTNSAKLYKTEKQITDENRKPYQNVLNNMVGKTEKVFQYSKKRKQEQDEFSIYNESKRNNSPNASKQIQIIPPKNSRILEAPGLLNAVNASPLDCTKDNRLAFIMEERKIYTLRFEKTSCAQLDLIKLEITSGTADPIRDPRSLKWIQNSHQLAIGTGSSQKIVLWDAEKNQSIRTYSHPVRQNSPAISHIESNNPNTIYASFSDGYLIQTDLRMSMLYVNTHTTPSPICSLSVNENRVACGLSNGIIQVFDRHLRNPADLAAHSAPVHALQWMPSNPSYLASASTAANGQMKIWDANNRLKCSIDTEAPITSLHWSRNTSEIVGLQGGNASCIGIWGYSLQDSAFKASSVRNLPKLTEIGRHSTLSGDGTTMILGTNTGADDKHLEFWHCFKEAPKKIKKEDSFSRNLGLQTIR